MKDNIEKKHKTDQTQNKFKENQQRKTANKIIKGKQQEQKIRAESSKRERKQKPNSKDW